MSSNRKKRAIVLSTLGFITLVSFQNCKQLKSNDLASSVNSDISDGATNNTDNGSSIANEGNGTSLEKKITDCMQYVTKPSVLNLSLSEVNLGSGLGTSSGDVPTPEITVSVRPGITNTTAASEKTCPITTNIQFDVIDMNDGVYSPLITTAKNIAGDEMVVGTLEERKAKAYSLATKAITRRGDGDLIDAQTGQVKISVTNNRNARDAGRLRCVSGVMYFSVVAKTEIGNQTLGKRELSDRQILKLNVTNNCWSEFRMPTPNLLGRGVQFGSQVAISGSTAVAISPIENDPQNLVLGLGSAYVYDQPVANGNWNFHSKLVPNLSVGNENINSVAISNDRIYLGSKYYKNGVGVVYIYEKNQQGQWILLPTRLESPTQIAGQGFAHSIKAKGNTILVGSPEYSQSGTSNKSGVVYVYQLVNGSYNLVQTLSPNGTAEGKGFGASIDMDGGVAIIGAPMASNWESTGTGEAQVFGLQSNQFVHIRTLTPPGTMIVNGQKFGASVALSGKSVAVGAPWYSTEMGNPDKAKMGVVYYFADLGSTANPTLFTTNGAGFSLGQAVVLNTFGLFIGVPGRDNFSGSVDYYRTADIPSRKLTYRHIATNTVASDKFGSAIASDGINILVGATTKANPNTSSGAVYLHVLK